MSKEMEMENSVKEAADCAEASAKAAELMDEEIERVTGGATEDWDTQSYNCVVCPNCQHIYHLTIGHNRVTGQTVWVPFRCPSCLYTGGPLYNGEPIGDPVLPF